MRQGAEKPSRSDVSREVFSKLNNALYVTLCRLFYNSIVGVINGLSKFLLEFHRSFSLILRAVLHFSGSPFFPQAIQSHCLPASNNVDL